MGGMGNFCEATRIMMSISVGTVSLGIQSKLSLNVEPNITEL
jgi:hypothetical protein